MADYKPILRFPLSLSALSSLVFFMLKPAWIPNHESKRKPFLEERSGEF
jgi:hypothetical protein